MTQCKWFLNLLVFFYFFLSLFYNESIALLTCTSKKVLKYTNNFQFQTEKMELAASLIEAAHET